MDIAVKSNEINVGTKQLLRHHQREEMGAEVDGIKRMVPDLKNPKDRAIATKRMKRLEDTLVSQSPATDLPGAVKDKLYARAKAIEEKVSNGMLSKEEMRKNPAGSVGKHMKWEAANKKDILEWKNIQIMLDPESNDPDLSNLERIRPDGVMDRFRSDAQISGMMNYRNIPQENWDQAFQGKGPENTALKQAERVQKRGMSDEARKAAAERMRKMHEAKRQKAAQRDERDVHQILEGEAVELTKG